MIGAIIGDIVGSRFEFAKQTNRNFTLFTDECGYTDDTICTVAIADAIMNHRSYKDSLHDWCRRYPDPVGGYGARFLTWIESEADSRRETASFCARLRFLIIGYQNLIDFYSYDRQNL